MSTQLDQPGYSGQPPQGGHDSRPTSVAAIIGLVGAFVFWPVGLIASIIGISHTKPGRKKGRGLAIAGLVVSILAAIVAIFLIVAIAGAASSSVPAAVSSSADSVEAAPAEPAPADQPAAEPAEDEAPAGATASQAQALRAAEQYLDVQGMSRLGLIQQLSSDYGSQFSVEDATWAADNVGADWNEQAARAAESYLEVQGMSREGLIDQLSSEYGSQFTREEAEYGATQAGL